MISDFICDLSGIDQRGWRSIARKRKELLSLFLCLVAVPVQGAVVSVTASGVMREFTDPDSLLPFNEPAPGTLFTLTFTYDNSTPDQTVLLGLPGGAPELGVYQDPLIEMTLAIGSEQFGLGTSNLILVFDDALNADALYVDLWSAQTRSFSGNIRESRLLTFATASETPPVPVLSSDALVVPSWPSGWNTAAIRYLIEEEINPDEWVTRASTSADLQSFSVTVVPIFGGVWLFGSALGLLGWIRGRKRSFLLSLNLS
jgi:hypothetical protein